jgi:hypothetical protein
MGCNPHNQESISSHKGEIQRLEGDSALIVVENISVFSHRALQRFICESNSTVLLHCTIYMAMQQIADKTCGLDAVKVSNQLKQNG